jgi:hypothetical protein
MESPQRRASRNGAIQGTYTSALVKDAPVASSTLRPVKNWESEPAFSPSTSTLMVVPPWLKVESPSNGQHPDGLAISSEHTLKAGAQSASSTLRDVLDGAGRIPGTSYVQYQPHELYRCDISSRSQHGSFHIWCASYACVLMPLHD